jgi:uracil DNA glycosylase
MTVQQKHLRGSAGASFTKAVVSICRAQMQPVVVLNWGKHQTGSGFQA